MRMLTGSALRPRVYGKIGSVRCSTQSFASIGKAFCAFLARPTKNHAAIGGESWEPESLPPPLAHRKPEIRSLLGPFSFCFKGVWRGHPTFRDWLFGRNRSLNALRLFPSALRSNRDGFKRSRDFSMLAKSKCAAVEVDSCALGANGDTRRRRGCAC